LLDRFAALSGRERLLILVAVFAVAYQLADLVIFDRQYREIDRIGGEIARDRNAIGRVDGEFAAASLQAAQDPDAPLRQQIEQLRAETDGLRARLDAAARELISPQDMAHFLEELLVQERELTLLRLQTLEVRPLLEPAAADSGALAGSAPVLHRHGFEIEFSGGYMATLRYLQALEALPWRFFWDGVDYEVVDYPQSVVRLRLHTLGLSEDWIGV
jgi:MSHA biogenesis protein MshJ